MQSIGIFFQSISCIFALLAAALLLWVNKERKHSNRLLAFILIIFAAQHLQLILLFSRLILKMPGLLRVLAPTTFLVAPLAFVYIRSVLNNELKFRKYDWLMVIPAILTLINFIPYYILPTNEKIDYLYKNFYNQVKTQDAGRGLLPSIIYYIIRVCWSGFFLWIGFRLISRFKKTNSAEIVGKNKILLNWLFTFNSLLTAVLFATALKIFIPTLKNTQLTIGDILLGVTVLFFCLQLFIRPQILYGVFQPLPKIDLDTEMMASLNIPPHPSESMPFLKNEVTDKAGETNTSIHLGTAEQLRYKNLIENYFREKRPFLNPAYSLEQLVADTQIPRYILSAFINREYGMGFREFINRQRVEYMISNMDKPAWKQFTLEAIAAECGFSSRITFFNNFKQITGQSPSDYLKALQKK